MKNISTLLVVALLAVLGWQCQSSGTTIEGTIPDAQNMTAYLDHVIIGKASNILANTKISPAGKFEMSFPEGLEAGVYNLRVGAQRINLVFDGKEKKVSIDGSLNSLQDYSFKLDGSSDSQVFANVMQGLIARRYSINDITNFIDTVSNPTLGAYVAFRSLGNLPQFLEIQKKAQSKLATAEPNSEMAAQYGMYISTLETQTMAQQSDELIQLGQPAPDIRLTSPSGKEYALSDLKGKVVLLDFWASWCGPCRRENPNVVEVYKKYNKKGFEVFSVSLDGVDSRTAERMGSQEEVNKMMSSSKQRWVDAIAQDGLLWKYHVSDLRKWEAAPAALYGVRSIPRTFLIDREGKIAAVNLRGAEAIETELQKHLILAFMLIPKDRYDNSGRHCCIQ
jgi:thiol-disulfide isomerase/thioredoxin